MEGSSPRTNPSFVYHTPWVRFAEILKPRIEYGRSIDIAKLPKEQGKDPETVLQRPLEDHLSRLFKRFFESVPNPGGEEPAKRRMQLTCPYQYDLNKPANENDLLVITVPIVMAPPFDFTIPDGKNPAGKSFPQSLTEAIKTWLDERNPVRKEGPVCFRHLGLLEPRPREATRLPA